MDCKGQGLTIFSTGELRIDCYLLIFKRYISGINYAIRSSLYLLLLILDNIVSSDRVTVS